MDGNWWFKFASTVVLLLISLAWLVWTVGGWATPEEADLHKKREAELIALVDAADEGEAKAAAQVTLTDHQSKPMADAPGWANFFPTDKISLGLDLQGGIDLELQVDIRKAVEAAADRYSGSIVSTLKEESITAESKRIETTADIAVFLEEADEARSREVILEEIPLFDFLGVQVLDGKRALVYSFQESFADQLRGTALQQAVETIRNRIDKFGVTEPVILTKGADRITVQLPGLDDPQRAIDLVGKTAQLEFRMLYDEESWTAQRVQAVVDNAVEAAGLGDNYTDAQLKLAIKGKVPDEAEVLFKKRFDDIAMKSIREEPYLVNKKVDLTGEFIDYAQVAVDQFNAPYVRMELNSDGARIFGKLSGDNVGKRMAIVLDDNVNSAPEFREKIPGGVASIELGSGDPLEVRRDAEDLVVVLRAGALPAPIEILHNRTVGKTLGDDGIRSGRLAATLALLLVLGFMLVYYRASGFVANLAVCLNIAFILALLAGFGATLTLPGIAGIILTMGMAVDANVIIFERIREELFAGKSVRAAIAAGYDKATWTILDANITTFITGAVLYSYGSGPIKGFAVTLMVGIITSVFTALVVTRLIFDYLTHGRGIRNLSIGV
ncbi:MAG: protein translocase subunit SecD [Deltaproteobacteria bacterium]|nr:protein translocase subunit SecD [Deltaproteobacteria bacterium]